jgi:PIN domain-containing protein
VKVLFDNCTSPVLASTLNGFIEHLGHSAHHLKDLPCGRNADDVEWIALLAQESGTWMVITGDYRIQRNKAERAAYRQAKLFGFVLAPAYQKTPTHQIASLLLWRWPEMEKLFELIGGAALHELPIGRSGKIRPLPL